MYLRKNKMYLILMFQDYFSKFGYLSGPSSETGNLMSKEDFPKAIRNFQKFANLPETGVLDKRTRAKMTQPRCGNKDPITDTDDRSKRYVLAPSKWDKLHLTYRYCMYLFIYVYCLSFHVYNV